MDNITVHEETIDAIIDICRTIQEFNDSCDRKHFEDRYTDKEKLILVGYVDEKPA